MKDEFKKRIKLISKEIIVLVRDVENFYKSRIQELEGENISLRKEIDRKGQNSFGNPNLDPLTERQMRAIHAISRNIGWTKKDLDSRTKKDYGCRVSELSKYDASSLISEMQQFLMR